MTSMSNVDIGRYSKRLVQLFWDPEPKNNDSPDSPIWCLGRRYQTQDTPSSTKTTSPPPETPSSPSEQTQSSEDTTTKSSQTDESFEEVAKDEAGAAPAAEAEAWPAQFLDDFESRIWLTYRSNFPAISKSNDPKAASAMSFSVRLKSQLGNQGFTSDTGWGCMIRSGQSLLANALTLTKLGRNWIRADADPEERRILALFADDPRAPFSIHKFVEHGAEACGTFPGQWFGPSATAKCIQALCNSSRNTGIKVYVTGDGSEVYEDELFKIAKPDGERFQPTLLLVGTRLGIDRVTPVYWEALKTSLQMPQSVGIAGGRPSSSHYFVGVQGSSFFYLDPHQTRPALPYHEDPADYTVEDIDSCHTRRLRRLSIEEMDPSMLIAFLFRDEEDWLSWRRSVSEAPGKAIFHVADTEPATFGFGVEREGALDEVETFDDDDESETRK